jgi:hypothetical protein
MSQNLQPAVLHTTLTFSIINNLSSHPPFSGARKRKRNSLSGEDDEQDNTNGQSKKLTVEKAAVYLKVSLTFLKSTTRFCFRDNNERY